MEKYKSLFNKLANNPAYFGSTMLRVGFGIMFVLVAVKKFRLGYSGFAESLVGGDELVAQELPNILLYTYGYLLPATEFIAGILLLLNTKVRQAYVLVGIMYLTFIFGQQYNGNTAKVGTEYLPSVVALILGRYLYDKESESQESAKS